MGGDHGGGWGAAVSEEGVEGHADGGEVIGGNAEGHGSVSNLGDEVADFVGVEIHESGRGC